MHTQITTTDDSREEEEQVVERKTSKLIVDVCTHDVIVVVIGKVFLILFRFLPAR